MSLIYSLFVGALAGWLAGKILKGRGFGIVGNVVVGILGALVGQLLLGITGFRSEGGLLPSLITATLGAMVLLTAVGALRKA